MIGERCLVKGVLHQWKLPGDIFDETRSRSQGKIDHAGERQGDLRSEELLRKEGKLVIVAMMEWPMSE